MQSPTTIARGHRASKPSEKSHKPKVRSTSDRCKYAEVTPGTWKADGLAVVCDEGDDEVTIAILDIRRVLPEVGARNAKLMAAAKDMYELVSSLAKLKSECPAAMGLAEKATTLLTHLS